jgi:hypothetical protein
MFWFRYEEELHVSSEESKHHHPSELLPSEVAAVSSAASKGRYAR